MKNFNLLTFMKKIILFFLGMWIIQVGVALSIKTNIGADPFTVFTQGIAKLIGHTPGRANLIITFTFLVIICITYIKSINIGTILSMLFAGTFIDLMIDTLGFIPFENLNLAVKCLLMCLACVIVAIGFSILKSPDIGVAPNDLIPFIINSKTGFQYKWIRITMDLTFVTIGFALGGIVGIGTIIGALLTGPLIQYFMPKINSVIEKFILSEESNNSLSEEA